MRHTSGTPALHSFCRLSFRSDVTSVLLHRGILRDCNLFYIVVVPLPGVDRLPSFFWNPSPLTSLVPLGSPTFTLLRRPRASYSPDRLLSTLDPPLRATSESPSEPADPLLGREKTVDVPTGHQAGSCHRPRGECSSHKETGVNTPYLTDTPMVF